MQPIGSRLAATLATLGLLGIGLPARAVELGDGSTAFTRPPDFVGASTTFNSTYFWSATYYFTLNLLENAGEPLRQVTIAQAEGTDSPRFRGGDVRAFEGTRNRRGAELPVQARVDRQNRTTTVIFDPPVPPGRSVTIEIYPVRNPQFGGTYLYGVTAFPPGDKPRGQFIGYGRIDIHDRHYFW